MTSQENLENPRISMANATEAELRSAILRSQAFRLCLAQKHHLETTAGRHSIEVEKAALRICRFLGRLGVKTDRKRIVVAALCHDLGMADRKKRYKTTLECHREHPFASVLEARAILLDLDEKTEAAIRCHMWPLTLHLPTSREGWILSIADKQASIAGTLSFLMKMPYRALCRRLRKRRR